MTHGIGQKPDQTIEAYIQIHNEKLFLDYTNIVLLNKDYNPSTDPVVSVNIWNKDLQGEKVFWDQNPHPILRGKRIDQLPLKLFINPKTNEFVTEGDVIQFSIHNTIFRLYCTNVSPQKTIQNTLRNIASQSSIMKNVGGGKLSQEPFDTQNYCLPLFCPRIPEGAYYSLPSKPQVRDESFYRSKVQGSLVDALNEERKEGKTGFALKVKDANGNTEKIPIHPMVWTTFFEYGKVQCNFESKQGQNSEVNLEEVDIKAIKKIIEYFYTSQFPEPQDIDEWLQILKTLDYLRVVDFESTKLYPLALDAIEKYIDLSNPEGVKGLSLIEFAESLPLSTISKSILGIVISAFNNSTNTIFVNKEGDQEVEEQAYQKLLQILATTKCVELRAFIVDQLKKELISLESNSALWNTLFHFCQEQKNKTEEVKKLEEICLWFAKSQPQILETYGKKFNFEYFKEKTGEEIVQILKEESEKFGSSNPAQAAWDAYGSR